MIRVIDEIIVIDCTKVAVRVGQSASLARVKATSLTYDLWLPAGTQLLSIRAVAESKKKLCLPGTLSCAVSLTYCSCTPIS